MADFNGPTMGAGSSVANGSLVARRRRWFDLFFASFTVYWCQSTIDRRGSCLVGSCVVYFKLVTSTIVQPKKCGSPTLSAWSLFLQF